MSKVLIAYASKYGSTAEIAAAIGGVLEEEGLSVTVAQASAVNDLRPYEAVVLGSAVYVGNWMAEAVSFLEKYEAELAQRPLWLFSSGPTGTGDPREILNGWLFPESIQPTADRLGPRDIALFHGNIDLKRLNFGERLLVKAMNGSTGDYRDWVAIRAWGKRIAAALK
ncbi:MAG: flavodoxin domain-containing protein [Aggregatilineales bacterium]